MAWGLAVFLCIVYITNKKAAAVETNGSSVDEWLLLVERRGVEWKCLVSRWWMVAIELVWYDTLIRWSESHFSHCGQWIQHLSLIIATTHLSVFAKHHWYGSRLSFLTFWLLSLSYILFANIIYKIDNIRSLCVVYLVAICTFVSPMFLSGAPFNCWTVQVRD